MIQQTVSSPEEQVTSFQNNLIFPVLSTPWKIYLLLLIAERTLRFGEIKQALPSVSRSSITKYLTELEKDGFLYRTVFPAPPLRTEYTLSPLGLSLLPLLKSLVAWGEHIAQESFPATDP